MGEGGHVIVLAHGFGCDQRMWRQVAPELATDNRVVLFDQLGAGRSDTGAWRPEHYTSLADYARDLIGIIDSLGAEPVAFVGHSIAASIGLLAGIERPERFECIVMLCPNPCFINDPPDYAGGFERQDVEDLLDLMARDVGNWAGLFAPLAMKNEDRPVLKQELQDSICASDPTVLQHFARLAFLSDVRPALRRLRVPALILQSMDDAIAPAGVGAYMQARMPDARWWPMDVPGHCPHMSHPRETAALIRRYLQQDGEFAGKPLGGEVLH
jgi:sigma-B regulation protein RsbQ